MENRPKYPIYIVSKGRYDKTLTADSFEKHSLDYFIVVEPQEAEQYCKKLGKHRVLVLPFSNLQLGSYPARNYCWEHSLQNGYSKHWVFDDNINGICRWNKGKKPNYPTYDLDAIIYAELFSDTNNIDICGFEYRYIDSVPPKRPFKINTHVYSAMLINNKLEYRWRLKYNEDVDLCLQVLHNGGRTACCDLYMTNKVSTSVKMKGGNQDELYKGNNPRKKLLKAKMLEAVWPQYVKTIMRYNRYHHYIDWKVFQKKINQS